MRSYCIGLSSSHQVPELSKSWEAFLQEARNATRVLHQQDLCKAWPSNACYMETWGGHRNWVIVSHKRLKMCSHLLAFSHSFAVCHLWAAGSSSHELSCTYSKICLRAWTNRDTFKHVWQSTLAKHFWLGRDSCASVWVPGIFASAVDPVLLIWSGKPREAQHFLSHYEWAALRFLPRQPSLVMHAEMECTYWSEWAVVRHLSCFSLHLSLPQLLN